MFWEKFLFLSFLAEKVKCCGIGDKRFFYRSKNENFRRYFTSHTTTLQHCLRVKKTFFRLYKYQKILEGYKLLGD